MNLKLDAEVKQKILEWQKWRSLKNEAEKKDTVLSSELKTLVKNILSAERVNDWTNPVQIGNENLFLKLEFHGPTYRQEITPDMVGTRPMAQRGYEVLKVIKKEN